VFAANWNLLQPVYHSFNALLESRGYAYEGKSYRNLVRKWSGARNGPPQTHLIFAGFYGFSKVEEDMIEALSAMKTVEVLWDADSYYIENNALEAGLYFRKSEFARARMKPAVSMLREHELRINITGVAGHAGQAKYSGGLLLELFRQGKLLPDNTVLVLPDENMLFPVLYSIPEEIGPVNVTMGYPLRQSPFTDLMVLLRDLHLKYSRNNGAEPLFNQQAVRSLLRHPLMRRRLDKPVEEGIHSGRFLSAREIESNFGFRDAASVFRHIPDSGTLLQYLDRLYELVEGDETNNESPVSRYESITARYIRSELGLLRQHLSEHIAGIGTETVWQMARECLGNLKVPFSGEPVHGLQVMGFLETRALDFNTVILFSANEGILPSTSTRRSFIPYSLRKGFGLETYEDQDATYAYHFYRLLHRAKEVYLIYNTETGTMGGGEKSRYLLQITHELKSACGNSLKLHDESLVFPVHELVTRPPSVKKDDHAFARLARYLNHSENEKPLTFSPSALSAYIHCPLRFYLRYVAGLREPEEPDQGLDAAVFGKILHRAMELIYKEFTGREITLADIEQASLSAARAVDEAFVTEYQKPTPGLQGQEILLESAIRDLVNRILAYDRLHIPFRILGLEYPVSAELECTQGRIRIAGFIDRLETKDGSVSILDYKTGKVETSVADQDRLFADNNMQTAFQILCYTWIYRKMHPATGVKAGFYVARSLGSGNRWINGGETVTDEMLSGFETRLRTLIEEILDPAKNFDPTTETERCTYCPYKDICNR
jgi:CRISPR/Cas system-associated exonuclease Cas4 (RecB family)